MSGGQPGPAGAQSHTPRHAKPQTGEQISPKAHFHHLFSFFYQSQTTLNPFFYNFLKHSEAMRQPSLISSSVSRDRLLWSQVSSGGPLPPVSTLTSLHSLSASPASSPSLIMASLPSVMSLGEPSLLIGKVTVSDLSPRLSLIKQPNALVAGLASAQPQTVPVINNVGGFTTLQPISFQQQLHASPQQPITQHLQGHMASSPFMATMAPLPCHSTPAVWIIVSAFRFLEVNFSLICKSNVSLRGFRSLTPCYRCSVQQVGLASVPVLQPAVSGPGDR